MAYKRKQFYEDEDRTVETTVQKADDTVTVKREVHSRNNDNNNSGGGVKRYYFSTMIAFGMLSLFLAAAFISYQHTNRQYTNMLEGMYEKSYYDLTAYIDEIDNDLSKLSVTKDTGAAQLMLNKISTEAELAQANISQLPTNLNEIMKTSKFINQVGDYSKHLSKKIADGGDINDTDRNTLNDLNQKSAKINNQLRGLSMRLGTFSFAEMHRKNRMDGGINIHKEFMDVEKLTDDMPKMIYDGPFSDNLEESRPSNLNEPEVSKEQAAENLKTVLADYKLKDAVYSGETVTKVITTYNFHAKTEKGHHVYAQMSKNGGKLIMFDIYDNSMAKNHDRNACLKNAEDFLTKLGISGMKAVWTMEDRGVVTFNFAHIKDDVVVYTDLVKIKVSMSTGFVTGMEGISYYTNHKDREIKETALGVIAARQNVSDNLNIEHERLVIIPKGNNGEIYAYEFMGKHNDAAYYVYIDANTGRQAEIFKVIATTEGELLA